MRSLLKVVVFLLLGTVWGCSSDKVEGVPGRIVNKYSKDVQTKYKIGVIGVGVGSEAHNLSIEAICEKIVDIKQARILLLENLSILKGAINTESDEFLKNYFGWNGCDLSKVRLDIVFTDKMKKEREKPRTNDTYFVDDSGKISSVTWENNKIRYYFYSKRDTGYFGFNLIHEESLEEAKKLAAEDGCVVPDDL